MAEAPVSFLLKHLSVLLRELGKERTLLKGVRTDAEDAANALYSLTAALRVADEREEVDPQSQVWVNKARQLAYDAEDVLEEFLFRFEEDHTMTRRRFFDKIHHMYTSLRMLMVQHRLAVEMKMIKVRVEEISKHQPLPTSSTSQCFHDCREDALFLEDSDLVGIESPHQFLVDLLLEEDVNLKIHSIVGMGGLGKTTLARKAYNDLKLADHFGHHPLWLTVSENFSIEKALVDLVREVVKHIVVQLPQDLETMSPTQLKQVMYNILSSQRYFIVLDDIWSFDAWKALKYSFPKQQTGSRILITTRNLDIGRAISCETGGSVCPLNPLSPKDSWTLFSKKTFPTVPFPQSLVNTTEKILRCCGGLPLAITVVANILATKGDKVEDWEKFCSSIGYQFETNKSMKILLSMSYYDLPYYLKYCFLYLSIFPEDYIISKNTIIQMWIAEDFVTGNGSLSKEEVAEDYLNELIHRNLIEIAEKTSEGRMTGFKVHAILREIIISKAADHNFSVIATGQKTEWSSKLRRLAVHKFDECIVKGTLSSSGMQLRSLIVFQPLTTVMLKLLRSKLLSTKCVPLKVLYLTSAQLKAIPKEVLKLVHLKYLSFRNTSLEKLPHSIGRLKNLETLDLKCTKVNELPDEILKLRNLRHLLCYSTKPYSTNKPWIEGRGSFSISFQIGGLQTLQSLCDVKGTSVVKNRTSETNNSLMFEIGKLTQLRKLGVTDLKKEDGEDFCLSLGKLTNLYSLSLGSTKRDEMLQINHLLFTFPLLLRKLELRGRLEKLPRWLHSLGRLTSLNLFWSRLAQDPIQFLQNLPCLVDLVLLEAYEGDELCFNTRKFPQLRHLAIIAMDKLKRITVENGAMPVLEELIIADCTWLEPMEYDSGSFDPWVEGKQHFSDSLKMANWLSLPCLCRTKSKYVSGSPVVFEIRELKHLRRLALTHLKQQDCNDLCSSVARMENLTFLSLRSADIDTILDIHDPLLNTPPHLHTMDLRGRLQKVPTWLSSLVSLTRLNLFWSRLTEDPLPHLQNLPLLAQLYLENSFEWDMLSFTTGKFSQLKLLDISRVKVLRSIKVEEGAMPLLQELIITYCESLRELTLWYESLSDLKAICFCPGNSLLVKGLCDSGIPDHLIKILD